MRAAERLYKKYNFSGGNMSSYELSSMMSDTYGLLQIRMMFVV
jgi:hypothetical protein